MKNQDITAHRNGGAVATAEPTFAPPRFVPAADIFEDAEAYVLRVDMPGVDPKAIDIDLKDGALTIAGKAASRQAAETPYLLREYGVGDYARVFNVTESIDASRITAEYADGVLTLRLPKPEAAKARKIQVKAK